MPRSSGATMKMPLSAYTSRMIATMSHGLNARRSAVSEAVAQLVEDALDVRQRIVAPTWRRNVLPISHQRVVRQAAPERNTPDSSRWLDRFNWADTACDRQDRYGLRRTDRWCRGRERPSVAEGAVNLHRDRRTQSIRKDGDEGCQEEHAEHHALLSRHVPRGDSAIRRYRRAARSATALQTATVATTRAGQCTRASGGADR